MSPKYSSLAFEEKEQLQDRSNDFEPVLALLNKAEERSAEDLLFPEIADAPEAVVQITGKMTVSF